LTKVVVIGGGNSPEREVSLRSAAAVADAAQLAGFDVMQIDPQNGWQVLDQVDVDSVVLPILHGIGGEDGEVQTELEQRKLMYLGSGSKASEVAFDKWQTKQLLNDNHILTPAGDFVTLNKYKTHIISKSPHVLKANRNGSSIGVYVVHDPKNIDQVKVNQVFDFGEYAVLEELIEGTEITVPVLGERALPVIEIIPPHDAEFDYENKYNGETQELCPPKNVTHQLQKIAQNIAEQVHKNLGCLHISRTDMIIDRNGKLFVLEINTMPGMTDQSLFPKSAAIAGFSFPELAKQFVAMASSEKRYT